MVYDVFCDMSVKLNMEEVAVDKIVYKEAEAANYICMSRSFLSQDRVNGALAN